MRILQINTVFFPAMAYGGTVNVTYNLSKKLIQDGHDVTVYTSDSLNSIQRQACKYQYEDGIKVYYLKNISNRLAWKRFFLNFGIIKMLKEHITEFDIVHIHDYRAMHDVVLYLYAIKYHVPYIVQAHGSLPYFKNKKLIKKCFDKLFGNRILRSASKVIALTETEADYYKKFLVPEDKIVIIPNGIDLEEYNNLPEYGKFRMKYGLTNSDKICLYLGRLNKTKGIELILQAATLMNNDIKIVIAGPDDGYLCELKKLANAEGINNKILFVGPIYGNNKYDAYIDADIFVTPKYSGFPVSFLEACACGVPIITTTCGDKLDWIKDNVGYVIDYNKNILAEAINDLSMNKTKRKLFSYNGKKLIKEYFNWSNIVHIYEHTYSMCISSENINRNI